MTTQDIFNYRKVSDNLITAGQPTEEQLRAAAAEGFTVVINEVKKVTQWFAGGDSFLAVCLKDTGRFIAFVSLNREAREDQREYNLGYVFNAHFSENAWMRAIYADDTPIGFILLHIGSDYDDGIDCPGVFLWRFMIAGPYQGKGYGKRAMERLLAHLHSQGARELYTSCGLGEASPEGFYRRLGFAPTGETYGDETELVLKLSESDDHDH